MIHVEASFDGTHLVVEVFPSEDDTRMLAHYAAPISSEFQFTEPITLIPHYPVYDPDAEPDCNRWVPFTDVGR